MSEVSVGIIAEGPHDITIIAAAIKAMYPDRVFQFTQIQPSDEYPKYGGGWGGVYKACRNLKNRLILQELLGTAYDILVIHIDGDVCSERYSNASISDYELQDLPCINNDESINMNCERLMSVVTRWIGGEIPNISFCIPYLSTDLWAAYSLYTNERNQLVEGVSNADLLRMTRIKAETEKLFRSSSGKFRKNPGPFILAAEALTVDVWRNMVRCYNRADAFQNSIVGLVD